MATKKEKIVLKTCIPSKNWGDAINCTFVELLTGVLPEAISIHDRVIDPKKKSYLIIGSTLGYADSNSIVWGSGFIRKGEKTREKPKKICAVRGPKTRRQLLENNIDCPEVFGDPVLLLPKFYYPNVNKKFKLGIIPHFVDNDNLWLSEIAENNSSIKIIDIENPSLSLIDQVLQCEKIASSSLHGLILSDAYSVPSLWVQFSDKIIGKDFKFLDYFESVGRKDLDPLKISGKTTINQILSKFRYYKIKIDLNQLFKSCPLINQEEK